MPYAELDQRCTNTIRFLAADGVQKAKSGHPGTPMGAATIAYVLWDRFLKHNPANPKWIDRDRFVLSAGHASMLLYSLLHLTGYDVSLDDLKSFRQWGSKTPGHPEYGVTPGVEATAGPLGQGFANGVGMAVAEQWLAQHFNAPDAQIIDHYTYALVSDGDMEEGLSSEAASLAATWKLGKLIYLYDCNGIQIEGSTGVVFTEDVAARFKAYGWHVVGPINGHDPQAVEDAIRAGQAETERPTLIVCHTHIGFGAPTKQDTASAHGEPLGDDELRAAKQALGWPVDPSFYVPDDALAHMRQALKRGGAAERDWQKRLNALQQQYPDQAAAFKQALSGELPAGWEAGLADLYKAGDKPVATREASGRVLNVLAPVLPTLMGGSADLSPSTRTILKGFGDWGASDRAGRNMHFGVREHAMGSICNGLALHGGVMPYASTFLVFSDYMRPPIRLAALMGLPVVYVFTHDSIGVGEDGPTHQPIEQVPSLRLIPNLTVIRPADATETVQAWQAALLNRNGPTALILTRQNLPVLDRTLMAPAQDTQRGGYVLWRSGDLPDVILMGTGSEVHIALEAGKMLAADGIDVSVLSFPSWELFEQQSEDYQECVLPRSVRARVAVEAARSLGWEHYVGIDGAVVGIDRFGASAPYGTIYEHFGLTAQNVAEQARIVMETTGIAS
jgi:transketolase